MSSKLEPDVSSMFSMSMTAEPPPCAGARQRQRPLGSVPPPPPPARPHLHVVLEATPFGGGAAPAAARRRPRRGHGARPGPARAALAAAAHPDVTFAAERGPPRSREGERAPPPSCVWRRAGKGAAGSGNDKTARSGVTRNGDAWDAPLQGPRSRRPSVGESHGHAWAGGGPSRAGEHRPLLPRPPLAAAAAMAAKRRTDEMRERVVLGEFGVRNVSGAGRAGLGWGEAAG